MRCWTRYCVGGGVELGWGHSRWALGGGSVTYDDFQIALANLLGAGGRKVSQRIPIYGLYIDPPLGRCGMTAAEARASGRRVLIGRRPMSRVGRAKERGETRGFMQILADADTRATFTAIAAQCERISRVMSQFLSLTRPAPEAEGALGGLAMRLCRELGAPAVVAMSDRISIDTANALCGPFYRQLRAHGLVDLALAEACSQVAERADLVVPVLHARAAGTRLFPGTGPSGQVVTDRSEPEPPLVCEGALPLSLESA